MNVGHVARGDKRVPVIRDAVYDGWAESNISVDRAGRSVDVHNVRSVNAFRVGPADRFVDANPFQGQGLYLDGVPAATVRESYLARNGWQPGKPPPDRNGYRHGVYSNFGVGSLLVEDTWLDSNACAGLQHRGGPLTVRRCLLTDNAVALLLTSGGTIEDCTVYGAHARYNPPGGGRPASWVGGVALSLYHPTTLRNVWIVGRPGQGDPVDLIPGLKTYNLGAVVGSGSYPKPEWRPPVDAAGNVVRSLVTAADCRIVGWPADSEGKTFAGDRPHDGSGFAVAGSPVAVDLDDLRAEAMAGTRPMAAIVADGQKRIREAAAKTLPR